MLTGSRRADLVKLVAWLSAIVTAALSIWLLAAFDSGEAGFQFVSQHEWIEHWGISWYVGVDGISLLLVVLTGILFPLAFFTHRSRITTRSRTSPGCCCSRPG